MIKSIYFQLEIIFRLFKKNWSFILIGILIGFLSMELYLPVKNLLTKLNVSKQKIGMVGLYTIDTLPETILNQVSFGLTVFTNNNRTNYSSLVKDIQIENDNKDYVFTLNTNLKWHDGQNIKSTDINYQINGLKIVPLSKEKVRLSLDKPFSPILSLLTKPLLKKGVIGLGQFQIGPITYQKDFIKTITLIDTLNKNTKKIYLFYDQEDKLISAYKLGEIDSIIDISSPSDLTSWPKTKITPVSKVNDTYIGIFLNTRKIPQKDVRQALAYATPKNPNKEERCLSPISPLSWAYNNSVKEYGLDPPKAINLIKDQPLNNINLTVKNRRLLSLADDIKRSWQDILKVDVSVSFQNQLNPDFEAVLAIASIPKDPDQYEFWHSTQANNVTKINNPKIDKLLEEGRQVFDIQKRKETYQEFQKILLEESPVIFLSYPSSYNIDRLK